jgi:hypothetical protein
MRTIGIVVCCALLANLTAAQTSELVLTSTNTAYCYVVRNGQIVRQFSRTATTDGPALVVQNTIKMYGQATNNVGHEYDLNGNMLAGQYTNAGFIDCFDGATDGARNWTISHNDFSNNFALLVGDANWGNVHIAFVPNQRSSGVAYDSTDDTLWVSNNVGGCNNIQHYTTTGTVIADFPIASVSGGGYGIALDPADETLWMPGAYSTQGQLFQYDKNGALLQTLTIPGMNTDVLGAEFVPGSSIASYCTAGTTLNGCLAAMSSTGSPSVTAASGFTVRVANVEGQKQGMIFYGITAPIAAPWGAASNPSTSLLCVKAPVQRTGNQNSGGTVNACNGVLTLDFFGYVAAHPTALGNPFAAGQKAYFQGWFRDQGSPKTSSLSDALAVTFAP